LLTFTELGIHSGPTWVCWHEKPGGQANAVHVLESSGTQRGCPFTAVHFWACAQRTVEQTLLNLSPKMIPGVLLGLIGLQCVPFVSSTHTFPEGHVCEVQVEPKASFIRYIYADYLVHFKWRKLQIFRNESCYY
jgi:hypothetical protein